MSKNKKGAYAIIMTILIITLPLAIIGWYFSKVQVNESDMENKRHSDKFNNTLYFYKGNVLLGTYPCNFDACNYALNNTNDDETYKINYHSGSSEKVRLANYKYAFVSDKQKDSDKIKLLDVTTGEVIDNYDSVKNYNIGIENNYYIVSLDGKYGVIELNDSKKEIIPIQYDFIGLNNRVGTSGRIIADKFIVKEGDTWKLIGTTEDASAPTSQAAIVDYNDNVYVTYNVKYRVYSMDGSLKYYDDFESCKILNEYIETVDSEGKYTISKTIDKLELYSAEDGNIKEYSAKINADGNIDIYVGGQFKETVEI